MSAETSDRPRRNYLERIVLAAVVIIGVAVLGGVFAWMNRPPTYSSLARILVTARSGETGVPQSGTYLSSLQSEPFLKKVLANLPDAPNAPKDANELRRKLQISNIDGTDVVQIEYSSATAAVVEQVVQKVCDLIREELDDFEVVVIAPPSSGVASRGLFR